MSSTTLKRNDIHAPSKIEPSDYTFVGLEHQKMDSIGDCYAVKAEREIILAHMKSTGGTYSSHQHGGNCHICGAHCIYTALYYHAKTNVYIRTGMDCAEKMDMADAGRFRSFRAGVKSAMEAMAGKRKAKFILEEHGLGQCWDVYESQYQPSDKFPVVTTRDIVGKLIKYGSISEKQVEFLKRLLKEINNAPAIEAQRQAEKDAAENAPEGRKTFQAEVISTKVVYSQYGEQIKMLAKAINGGWKVWCTVPSALSIVDVVTGEDGGRIQRGLVRGDVIEVTATLTPSKDDPKFCFGSRPNGRMISAVV